MNRSMSTWILLCCALCACDAAIMKGEQPIYTGGDAERGSELIREFGCGTCHTIPGIRAARGVVGPPLYFFSRRTYVAGRLPNTPQNLIAWMRDPPAIEPGTAMPNVGLSEQQARDIAAYLYTLR